MKKTKSILVSGASIAGLTLSYWLNKHGFQVTVIEKSEGLRLGGQNIDIKGPAWEIIQKMGLDKKIKEAHTTEVGIRFVNTRNEVVAEFPKDNALSMTQDIEILRGDLVNILYQEVEGKVTFHFGDEIKKIDDSGHGVTVTFEKLEEETFDHVLIAEGIGSSTRQMVFQNSFRFDYLGLYSAYFTIKKADTDSRWARWHNAAGAIVFLIRPDNHGTTRVCIFFRSPEQGYEKLPLEEQRKLLIHKIENAGWEAPRIIQEIRETDDLYLERVSQVKATRWYNQRIAMVGDAAYCATPIAGKGTDLAITGAYVLAGELAVNEAHEKAFHHYEQLMRPYVTKVQQLPPGVPRLAYPKTKLGVNILNAFFFLAGSKPAKFLSGLFSKKKTDSKDGITLPDYNMDAASA